MIDLIDLTNLLDPIGGETTITATARPAALTATGTLGTATVAIGVTVITSSLVAAGTLGTATVDTAGSATARPSALTATGTLGTATVSTTSVIDVTVSVSPLAATGVLGTATVFRPRRGPTRFGSTAVRQGPDPSKSTGAAA